MLDFMLVENIVIMQISFIILLFLTVLTTSIYLFDVSNRKIRFMVLGNLSYTLLHGSVLLSANNLFRFPVFVGLFDVLTITFYVFAVFNLFNITFSKVRFLIFNMIHVCLLLYFDFVMEQVSILRLITTLFILVIIIDSAITLKNHKTVLAIRSSSNFIINVLFLFIYKSVLFGYRVYTMNIEVGIESINSSIILFTLIGVIVVIWINFTILFINYDLLNSQYKHLSLHDYLTDIPNRRYAMIQLEKANEEALLKDKKFGVLLLDIDDFKRFNDEHGHDFGDEVLIDFVKKFQSLIRSNDLFSRYGGDEFIVLLEIKSREEITYFIQRVTSYFENITLTSKSISIAFSIGKGYIDKSNLLEIETLLESIDKNLYANKRK